MGSARTFDVLRNTADRCLTGRDSDGVIGCPTPSATGTRNKLLHDIDVFIECTVVYLASKAGYLISMRKTKMLVFV